MGASEANFDGDWRGGFASTMVLGMYRGGEVSMSSVTTSKCVILLLVVYMMVVAPKAFSKYFRVIEL